MPLTKPKVQSIRGLDILSNIKSQATDLLRTILSLINNKQYFPMEITVSGKVVTISASENQVIESDGAGSTQNTYKTGVSPLERVYNSFAISTINYDTGAVTGAFETGSDLIAPPTMIAGDKIYMGYEALSTGKIHVLWSDAGSNPNVNNLAWTDASLKRGFILLTCATGGTGWASGRFNASTNSNITQFAGSGGGGGGGDSSFALRSISGSNLTLSRGALQLSNGDVLVSGSGTTSTTTRVDITVALGSVQNGTATPTNATTYYLYIDRLALSAAINLSDTGERVINVSSAGHFWLDTNPPNLMDPTRFAYVCWMRSANSGTAWTGTGALAGSAPKFRHNMESGGYEEEADFPDYNYVKNPNFEIDGVGAAPKYVTQNGQAGSGAIVTSTVGEVLYGTRSCKLTGGNTGGNLRSWDFALNTLSGYDNNGSATLMLQFVSRTSTTSGVFHAVIYNTTDAAEVPYTDTAIGTGDMANTLFFQPLSGKSYVVRIKEFSATTGNVIVDNLKLARTNSMYYGGINKYVTNVTTNSTALTLGHGLGGEPQQISLFYYDGTNKAPVDPSSVVVTKNNSSVVLNTNDFDFTGGKYLELDAYYQSSSDYIASLGTQFKSAWQTSTANTTIAHGLADMDAIRSYSVLEWDTTNNKRRVVGGLVLNFDATNFYIDWAGFSPSATLQYQIVAGGSPLPQALPTMFGGYTKFVGAGPGSYATLAAALVGAAAGDVILVAAPQTISGADLDITVGDIKIVFTPTAHLILATNHRVHINSGANNVELIRPEIYPTLAGTVASAIVVDANDCSIDNAMVATQTGTTVTNAISVSSGAKRNYARIKVNTDGGGTVTAPYFTDAGTATELTIIG